MLLIRRPIPLDVITKVPNNKFLSETFRLFFFGVCTSLFCGEIWDISESVLKYNFQSPFLS